MYDLHHVLNKVSANALLRGNSLMASDELALLRHLMKALDNPGVPIPLETTSIHNITDDDAKTGISLKQMSDLFRNVMGATPTGILVGQNLLSFDLLILRRFITKGADDGWRFLDTSVLSKVLWPGESASADSISERLGMSVRTGQHNALGDAAMTATHFVRIASKLIDHAEA